MTKTPELMEVSAAHTVMEASTTTSRSSVSKKDFRSAIGWGPIDWAD